MDLKLVAERLQFPEGPVAMADGSVILVEIRRTTASSRLIVPGLILAASRSRTNGCSVS